MFLSALLVMTSLPVALCYSAGAPSSACATMMPNHGVSTQFSTSPFYVTVNKFDFVGGEQIQVTLMSCGSSRFKGFFLQARQANGADTSAIGQFNAPSGTQSRDCTNTAGAVTHSSSVEKTNMTLTWTAPAGQVGHVVFRATFVQNINTIWVGVHSESMRDRSLTSSPQTNSLYPSPATCRLPTTTTTTTSTVPPRMTERSTAVPLTTDRPTNQQTNQPTHRMHSTSTQGNYPTTQGLPIDYDCGHGKGCASYCLTGDNQCSTRVTWRANYTSQAVHFQIDSTSPSGDSVWMALGFSNDTIMGNDSVIDCLFSYSGFTVQASFNRPSIKYNERIPNYGIQAEYGWINDNVYTCAFSRPMNNSNLTDRERVFDITGEQNLLLAWGRLNSDGSKAPHHTYPLVSRRVDFNYNTNFSLIYMYGIASGVEHTHPGFLFVIVVSLAGRIFLA